MENETTQPPLLYDDDYAPPVDYESLLARQTLALDELFEKYRAKMKEVPYFSDTFFNAALRTQAQCRATVEIMRRFRKDAESK